MRDTRGQDRRGIFAGPPLGVDDPAGGTLVRRGRLLRPAAWTLHNDEEL